MFKTFILLNYFHIQTSAIKLPAINIHTDCSHFPCFSAHTFNIEIYSDSNTLHSQAKRSEVSTAWNIPCSSEGRVALLLVT